MCRENVENVLSGMKAVFKSILNIFKHPNGESRMFIVKIINIRTVEQCRQ